MKIKKKTLFCLFLGIIFIAIASNYEPTLELTSVIITADTDFSEGELSQRYHVGYNEPCQIDCKRYADQNDAEYHTAIVRTWGQCHCRVIQ